jgi:type I restriction-modification system DNA methylase subunit
LHGIDNPSVWHGNTLTGAEVYGGLFQDTPALYDLVLTNPPFGGKEGRAAQTHFAYKTGSTQVLFLQHVIDSLKPGGDAPWSSMKEFYSARAKVPLFRQSGSCSTNVIFGAL